MHSTALRQLQINVAELPRVFTAETHNLQELSRQAAQGMLLRIRPGVYTDNLRPSPAQLDSLKLSAGLLKVREIDAISHFSAAKLWGFPNFERKNDVCVTRPPEARSNIVGMRVIRTQLSKKDIVSVNKVTVTSLERTALDCASLIRPDLGLAVVDYALKLGASKTSLEETLLRHPRTASKSLKRLIDLGVADSDSVPESSTRYWLYQAGFGTVNSQFPVRVGQKTFFLDCGIPEIRLAVEYDGLVKYEDPKALFNEKLREDAMRTLGWTFIRVTSSDLRNPALLVQRFRRTGLELGYDFGS